MEIQVTVKGESVTQLIDELRKAIEMLQKVEKPSMNDIFRHAGLEPSAPKDANLIGNGDAGAAADRVFDDVVKKSKPGDTEMMIREAETLFKQGYLVRGPYEFGSARIGIKKALVFQSPNNSKKMRRLALDDKVMDDFVARAKAAKQFRGPSDSAILHQEESRAIRAATDEANKPCNHTGAAMYGTCPEDRRLHCTECHTTKHSGPYTIEAQRA